MLVWTTVDKCVYPCVVPDVEVSVADGLYHRVGMHDFWTFTVDCRVYAYLWGKVMFSFPGPHVSSSSCAILFVHGVRHGVGVRFVFVIRGRLF